MKKFLNVASFISIGVIVVFAALIVHGKNVVGYDYRQSSLFMNVLAWVLLVASVIYPALTSKFDVSQNENRDMMIKIVIWGVLMVAGILCLGYLHPNVSNPYV
jgi:hypothetical protein